jgi:virulence-associated protein VapD
LNDEPRRKKFTRNRNYQGTNYQARRRVKAVSKVAKIPRALRDEWIEQSVKNDAQVRKTYTDKREPSEEFLKAYSDLIQARNRFYEALGEGEQG